MTHSTHHTRSVDGAAAPLTRQFSPLLTGSAVGLAAVGVVTGLVSYLHRSPVRETHTSGTAAWPAHLVLAAVALALYGTARWRRRRSGRDGGLLLLAPLGRRAASRTVATMRRMSWRPVAALPPLAMIGYGFWRTGEQITAGLDPNFTVNAWGGPTYLGAMACHYLDGGLIMAVCAWLLDRILLPSATDRSDQAVVWT